MTEAKKYSLAVDQVIVCVRLGIEYNLKDLKTNIETTLLDVECRWDRDSFVLKQHESALNRVTSEYSTPLLFSAGVDKVEYSSITFVKRKDIMHWGSLGVVRELVYSNNSL